MRQVTSADGTRLSVHELGGSGRPVLFAHATGFHGGVWEPLAAALGEGFERWAVDFRGHGASVVPEGSDLLWERFAEDVLAVVDDLDCEPGSLVGVGHSMGGAALLLAEAMRPGAFSGLWVYEPITPPPAGLGPVDGPNPLAEGALRRRSSFPSRPQALDNFAAKRPMAVLRSDVLHAYVRHGFVDGDDGAVHLACRPADESQIYRGGGAHDAFARLPEVTCPVVVGCGIVEPGPAMFAPAVVDALPQARLEDFDPLGHFGPLEAPAPCAASVRRFVDSL